MHQHVTLPALVPVRCCWNGQQHSYKGAGLALRISPALREGMQSNSFAKSNLIWRDASIQQVVIYDIKKSLHSIIEPITSNRFAGVDEYRNAEGNMLQYTAGFDTIGLSFIALKTAQTVHFAHSNGWIHGQLEPNAYKLDENSVTLLKVGLYGQSQQILDRIVWSPAHDYKARAELTMDPVIPNELMDIHSWAKTMYSLFSRSALSATLGPVIPLTRPQAMPEAIWNIVKQGLDENLNIQVNMDWMVAQLEAATGFL